ncbi:1838_t:CDS:1 [Paraglomus brasilianum]|uniref:1838_t:CDS:1 n=1 Tax=Paraglomus brasilianum TaxID=144538 RepID=A0A9N9D7R4_9GLOM|nr:1838_t:CDS:1 [Paraglomus brasilianum]
MPPKSKTTLTDSQKYELCLYARDNKKSRAEYVETKWQVRVNESTITQILQRSNQLLSEEEIIAPNAKKTQIGYIPRTRTSTEITAISASTALQDLETVQAFLLQENASEYIKMTNILERY